jgi:2-keto-4-pentenoate hydratase/2-oxohepta-3-ene-1,7-dioic acid hydratase in catechol pathway
LKIVRFKYRDQSRYGVLEGNAIHGYRGGPFTKPDKNYVTFVPDGLTYDLDKAKLLPPCQATKVVCLGVNYRHHADELKMALPELPLLFLKPSSAIIGPDDKIVLPRNAERIDYECELAVVIGKTAKNVAEERFADYVLGYTCFNDVTDRVAQSKDGQWTRAKGYDTFAPVGPWIDTKISPFNLTIETLVNGEVRQSGNTSDLIFGIPRLVSFISSIMTLLPGDIIATGTPHGVGPLKAGDTVEIRIEGLGTLRNSVVAAPVGTGL